MCRIGIIDYFSFLEMCHISCIRHIATVQVVRGMAWRKHNGGRRKKTKSSFTTHFCTIHVVHIHPAML